tara:strand:- start:56 stop:208 length:153 start_codon:yes stop_codon:yes gene_type:complete
MENYKLRNLLFILGVTKSTGPRTIKKAQQKLSVELHPESAHDIPMPEENF